MRNMSHNPSKDAADWLVVADFKKFIKFQSQFLKIWFSQTSPFVDICRHDIRCPLKGYVKDCQKPFLRIL